MTAANETESRIGRNARRGWLFPSVQTTICWLLVGGCVFAQLGCGALADPATQLAYCMEAATRTRARGAATTRATCDLGMAGEFLVVLHPQGALREQELLSAGVEPELLREFRTLRITDNAAIYVLATGPAVSGFGATRSIRSTRTTYQERFINIERLLVLAKGTQPVGVDIAGPPERIAVVAIH